MEQWNAFLKDESANGVVEVVLIIVVIIALVAIFRDKLKGLVKDLLDNVEKDAKAV